MCVGLDKKQTNTWGTHTFCGKWRGKNPAMWLCVAIDLIQSKWYLMKVEFKKYYKSQSWQLINGERKNQLQLYKGHLSF